MTDYSNMDEWDGLYSHEKDGQTGFITEKKFKSVVEVSVNYKQSRYLLEMDQVPEELIQRELAYRLGNEIIKGGFASYYKHFDQEMFEETVTAEINICPPGMKMAHVEDEMFKVNGEYFSEEEIIEAIKQTYPERLL